MFIDLGNTKGLSRTVDNLGRLVIPSEYRKELGWGVNDKVTIHLLKNGVYVEKVK